MHLREVLLAISFFLLGTISIGIAHAWSGPSSAPPGGNVAAPINVGTTDQVKNGGLGVNSLAVFGNSLLGGSAGSNAYLNFGDTSGSGGYGIRDNAGTLEFKNDGGSWASLQNLVCGWVSCVSGGVTLGSSCTTSGQIGYDSAADSVVYCSSGASNTWVSLGGGSSSSSNVQVAFSVNKGGTGQTVGGNVITKLTWPTEVFDTNNNFANDRFTPTVAGKYLINASLYCNSAATWCQVYIYKNGVNVASNFDRTSVDTSVQASTIVDMNGSTDYIEVYGRNGGSTSISGDTTLTQFTGSLLPAQSTASGSGSSDGRIGAYISATTVSNNSGNKTQDITIPSNAAVMEISTVCNYTAGAGTGSWIKYDMNDGQGTRWGCYGVSGGNYSSADTKVVPIIRGANTLTISSHVDHYDGFGIANVTVSFYAP